MNSRSMEVVRRTAVSFCREHQNPDVNGILDNIIQTSFSPKKIFGQRFNHTWLGEEESVQIVHRMRSEGSGSMRLKPSLSLINPYISLHIMNLDFVITMKK